MLTVYACITRQHDLKLVALAALVCLIASATTTGMFIRTLASGGVMRVAWLHATAFTFGSGVWATHFVGELAYRPPWPIGFAPGLTALSLGIAVLGSLSGFALAATGSHGTARIAAGGAVLGLTVAAMHYVGMAAVRPAALVYAPSYVAASLAIALAGGSLALPALARRSGIRGRAMAASALAATTCGLHFTGMAAVRLVSLPMPLGDAGTLAGAPLALAVAAVVTAVPLLGLLVMLADQQRRFRQFADATFEGILFHRDGIITDVNAALCGLAGATRPWLIGRRLSDLLQPPIEGLPSPPSNQAEAELVTAQGGRVPVEILERPFQPGTRLATVVAVRDTTERNAAERRIEHLGHYDSLTELPNRALFRLKLLQAMDLRTPCRLALLWIDLDRFTTVNDLLGHATGDRVLIEVARRLLGSVRELDTVARLGSDEFAIVQLFADATAAAALARRLVEVLGSPFEIDGQRVDIGASVGVTLCPQDARAADDLKKHAELALSRAKQGGGGQFCFFEPGMDAASRQRREIEQELRRAIEDNALELHYQPLFATESLEASGCEALLRWRRRDGEYASPTEFIPIAEESGLIVPLGRWVLQTACAEAATWPEPLSVAVNCSPVQFAQDGLPECVAECLERSGLSPQRLTIEITEGILIGDTERALRVLSAIKALGVKLALDDFGTGYSSLGYLRRFPFDIVKIDRSFVQGLGAEREADTIVRSIMAMCQSLDLTVVAEGVETDAQLSVLRSHGCDRLQGFLLGKPMAPGALGFAAQSALAAPATEIAAVG